MCSSGPAAYSQPQAPVNPAPVPLDQVTAGDPVVTDAPAEPAKAPTASRTQLGM